MAEESASLRARVRVLEAAQDRAQSAADELKAAAALRAEAEQQAATAAREFEIECEVLKERASTAEEALRRGEQREGELRLRMEEQQRRTEAVEGELVRVNTEMGVEVLQRKEVERTLHAVCAAKEEVERENARLAREAMAAASARTRTLKEREALEQMAVRAIPIA
jgi:hypothetical protein